MTQVLTANVEPTWTHVAPSSISEEQRRRPLPLLVLVGVTAASLTVSTPVVVSEPVPTVTAIPASAAAGGALAGDHALGHQVRALKEASGLTWAQFAGFFGVTRRAVHFWAEGGRMSADHVARLERVRRALDQAGGSTPAEARAALFTAGSSARTPFAELIAEVNRSKERPATEASPLGSEESLAGVEVPGTPVATEDVHGITPRDW